jgi:hypothetical protein
MFARYFFIALGIASLLWIGYVAADLIDQRNAFAPTSVFGKEDGKVLVLNRMNEADLSLLPFKTTPKNHEIINSIKPHLTKIKSLFISATRRVILIETDTEWNKNSVNELLKQTGLTFKSTGLKSFEAAGYEIEYHKKSLYFHAPDIETTTSESWGNFDRKSSAVIVDFSTETPSVLEVYFRQDGKVEFITKNLKGLKGKHIDDKAIFASGLPKNLKKYHFYQKEFAAFSDPVFESGPMNSWVKTGFVAFEFKGKKALVTDYLEDKSPIGILNKLLKTEESDEQHGFFQGAQLSSDFPSSLKSGFHIFIEGDFVVISEEEWVGTDIVGQLKLENTLSSEQYAMDDIFKDLPSRVSERYCNGDTRYTKTVYKFKLLETHLGNKLFENLTIPKVEHTEDEENEPSAHDESVTYKIDAKIKDFIAFNGKGNFVALTETGELMSYANGRMNWIKNLNSKTIGGINFIEEYQFILVTTKNAIHLLDKSGKYVTGGPVSLGSKTPTQQANQFNFKGRMYLTYPDVNGHVVVYDARRKKISAFPHGLSKVTSPIDIWVSQEKLFFGILNNSAFVMLEAEKKREYRSFPLPGESISIISNNELFLLTSEGGQLSCVNQKGIKTDIRSGTKGKLMASDKGTKESYMSNFNHGQIQFYGTSGSFLGKINTESKEPEFWMIQTIDGKSYVPVVDGLDNNVYVYELDGAKITDRAFEGSKKCMLSRAKDDLILTTIVDKYLVQYRITR